MDYLKEDENIEELIVSMINDFREGVKDEDIYSQVIDPFSSMIEASLNKLDYENWIKSETSRQRQKTLQNAIGKLHQKLLGSISGVEDLTVGNLVDILCQEKKIIAEVKTKHNTVKKTDLYSVYDELKEALNMPIYEGYTAYYVEMIPSKPLKFNEAFTPMDNNTKVARPEREDIKRIDGRSFYELLTGDSKALEKMNNKIQEILINNFDLQEPEQFKKLFLRAYDINFFLKEKCPKISQIEVEKNIELIETKQCSIKRKLTWKHNNCEFQASIKKLQTTPFKCPTCKIIL
jgi:hypothetical protein